MGTGVSITTAHSLSVHYTPALCSAPLTAALISRLSPPNAAVATSHVSPRDDPEAASVILPTSQREARNLSKRTSPPTGQARTYAVM